MVNDNDDFENDDLIDLAQNAQVDTPEFDLVFQQGLLKLSIEDDHFASQLVRYLGNDKDLKEYQIFDNAQTQQIFQMIVDSLKKYSSRPTEGQLRQQIMEVPEDEQEAITAALDGILKVKTHNDVYYRKHIGKFVQQCKFFKGMLKVKKLSKDFSDEAVKHMEEVINDIYRVNFEKEDVLNLSDFEKYYNEVLHSSDGTIPTGITQMDKDMLGGLPRGGLVTVLAGTNVGKSIFVTSLGCQAIKTIDKQTGRNRKLKVFHLNFEGRANATLFRYMSNLAQVSYRNITLGSLTPEELGRLKKVEQDYGEQFKIRNFAGSFGKTIQEVYSYCREVYKDFKFDMLIVDYGQLLETTRKVESQRHVLADVFRGLDSMAKEFKAVVISPAQATRSGQESQNQTGKFAGFKAAADAKLPVLRSADISEAFEIARVSEVILSLNRTDDEVDQQKLRVFLEKQREGSKNKSYGIITNYPMSDVITGNFYDPMSKAVMENEKPEEFEKMNLSESQKDPEVSLGDEITVKMEQMDSLVEDFKDLDKKENGSRVDYNQELRKPNKNMDIINQYSQDLEKYKNKKMQIVKKAQEIIKVIYPEATEALLKELDKSYKDLIKSDATEDQILSQEKIINRYKLGLKGKI